MLSKEAIKTCIGLVEEAIETIEEEMGHFPEATIAECTAGYRAVLSELKKEEEQCVW